LKPVGLKAVPERGYVAQVLADAENVDVVGGGFGSSGSPLLVNATVLVPL